MSIHVEIFLLSVDAGKDLLMKLAMAGFSMEPGFASGDYFSIKDNALSVALSLKLNLSKSITEKDLLDKIKKCIHESGVNYFGIVMSHNEMPPAYVLYSNITREKLVGHPYRDKE